jgi:uncharacterized protein (TIGR00299 family) protein
MRVAFFDCFSGISGDMALAALVHAGADLSAIRDVATRFPIDGLEIDHEEVDVRGISAVRVTVRSGPQGVIRTYGSLRVLLESADLPDGARRFAQRAYRRLADAAAIVHGKDPELVTFHDFGEADCLVDFVGCGLALEMLGVERVFASPVPTGMGMARTEHGMMPIPSPVVTQLLQGVPSYSRGVPVELVTPAGAAILVAASEGYGDMPMMRADHVGYGAGTLRLDFPNVLRVVIGEEARTGRSARDSGSVDELVGQGTVLVEGSVDADASRPEDLLSRVEAAGATEAWLTPVTAPGGPRLIVSALGPASSRDDLVAALRAAGVGSVRISPVFVPPA